MNMVRAGRISSESKADFDGIEIFIGGNKEQI